MKRIGLRRNAERNQPARGKYGSWHGAKDRFKQRSDKHGTDFRVLFDASLNEVEILVSELIAMKQKVACFNLMLLSLLALAFSSCADQEGSGLDGPPDSASGRSSLGPGQTSIRTSW
jgi:hypothetical protein